MADDVPVESQVYQPGTPLSGLVPFEAYKGGQLPSYMVHPADQMGFPAMWRSYVPPGFARVPGTATGQYNADQNDRAIARADANDTFIERTKRLLGFGSSGSPAGAAMGTPAAPATGLPVMRGAINGSFPAGYIPPKPAPISERLGMVPARTPAVSTIGVRG